MPTAMPSRTIERVVSAGQPQPPGQSARRGVQAHLLDRRAAVAEEVEGAVGAVGSPAGPVRKRAQGVVGGREPGHRAGERGRRPGCRPPAWSSREPWPAPRWWGSTVRSVSSPVATGSQSGSVAGPVTTKPVTRLRSRATSTRLRASRGAASDVAPALGDLVGVEGGEHLGGQQVGVRRPPGAHLDGGDGGGVVAPGDAGGDVGAGHGTHPTIGAESVRRCRCASGPRRARAACRVRLLEVLEPGLGAAEHQRADRLTTKPSTATGPSRAAPRRRRASTPSDGRHERLEQHHRRGRGGDRASARAASEWSTEAEQRRTAPTVTPARRSCTSQAGSTSERVAIGAPAYARPARSAEHHAAARRCGARRPGAPATPRTTSDDVERQRRRRACGSVRARVVRRPRSAARTRRPSRRSRPSGGAPAARARPARPPGR